MKYASEYIDELEAKNKQLKAELASANDSVNHSDEVIEDLIAKNERLEADNKRLREALEKYGRHIPNCHYARDVHDKCTCGLAKEK